MTQNTISIERIQVSSFRCSLADSTRPTVFRAVLTIAAILASVAWVTSSTSRKRCTGSDNREDCPDECHLPEPILRLHFRTSVECVCHRRLEASAVQASPGVCKSRGSSMASGRKLIANLTNYLSLKRKGSRHYPTAKNLVSNALSCT